MPSMKRHIFDALEAQLVANLPWAKTISWEKIRLLSSDFASHEIPVVQFYHLRTDYDHSQGRLDARMRLVVEVVTKATATATADQRTLFDLMEDVELAVGLVPNLGVPGVIHVRYLSDESDIHTIEPFFLGVLTFEVIHRKGYAGCTGP